MKKINTINQMIEYRGYNIDSQDFDNGLLFKALYENLKTYLSQPHSLDGLELSNKAKLSQWTNNHINQIEKINITTRTQNILVKLINNVVKWYKLNISFDLEYLTYSNIKLILKVSNETKVFKQFSNDMLAINKEFKNDNFDELVYNDIIANECDKYINKKVKLTAEYVIVSKLLSGKLSLDDITSKYNNLRA